MEKGINTHLGIDEDYIHNEELHKMKASNHLLHLYSLDSFLNLQLELQV